MGTRRPNKRPSPAGMRPAEAVGLLIVLLVAVWVFVAAWLCAQLGGTGHGGLVGWVIDDDGSGRWNTAATGWALLFGLLTAVVVGLLGWGVWKWRSGREWTDALASSMSSTQDLAEMTERAVAADTRRLGADKAGTGVRLGKAVLTGQDLFGTFEWSQIWVMGTRAGKTRSVAIPQIVEHRGPVITTSNKRDVHDRTRGPRSELGHCWVNDPQQIAKQPPTWWWNPLSFVTSAERAEQLVEIWAAARSSAQMGAEDPYFEPAGRNLLSNLVMAAALGGEPVTRLPDWLTGFGPRPGVPDPVEILREAGYAAMAKDIETTLDYAQEQRDGIYGTAQSFIRFLRSPEFVAWIAPTGRDDQRPQFSPEAFVRAPADTLYLLSKEGAGSARAITGALTAAVYAAAEDYAEQSGDRVPVPVLFVLDEAANVCRWPELPNLYSHAGSKGLILVTILQSPAQGEQAWGKDGWRKMWSASNVVIIGRGVNDDEALSALSRMVGDRQIADRSLSVGTRGHRSTGTSLRDERILTEADLRAMPRGRAVLLTSGSRAVLLNNVDYSQHPWAHLVDASNDYYRNSDTEEATSHA